MKLLLATALLLAGTASFAGAEEINILNIQQNVPAGRAYYEDIAKAYEAEHPGVTVKIDFMDETLKRKLPTMLMSPSKPDAFFTWAGGVFHEQARAGVLQDISSQLSEAERDTYAAAGLSALTYDGKLYGIPVYDAGVVLFYNKSLLDEAGVDPASIKTWSDFLAAVQTVKDAGITPIILGGKDKWPVAFYWDFLALRLAGADGVAAANDGADDGFASDAFVETGKLFKELVDLEPFQPGFMDASPTKASGLFGDGEGAFYLFGNYGIGQQKANSVSGEGLGDDLGFIEFPMVEGGKGDPATALGGINGFLVTEGASESTADFLKFMTSRENQIEGGRLGLWLPIVKNSQSGIAEPKLRRVAEILAEAPGLQIYLDQALGASVGAALNDAAVELATGEITPEDAAQRIERARQMR